MYKECKEFFKKYDDAEVLCHKFFCSEYQTTTQPTKQPTEQPNTQQPTKQPTEQPTEQPTDNLLNNLLLNNKLQSNYFWKIYHRKPNFKTVYH